MVAVKLLWLVGIAGGAVSVWCVLYSTPIIAATSSLTMLTAFVGALIVQHKVWIRYLKTILAQVKLISETFHRVTHTLRDDYYHMQRLAYEGRLNAEVLRVKALETGQEVVDLLANALTACTSHNISVCIKIFEQPREMTAWSSEDLERRNVVTLCRSYNTNRERWESVRHPILHNTAFHELMFQDKHYFASTDLAAEHARGVYMNTSLNWSRYYRSTIVVPIRIRVGTTETGLPVYDILGFLCADSESTFAFEPSRLTDYANLMMAAGDAMYAYFDRIFVAESALAAQDKGIAESEVTVAQTGVLQF